jgi:hypothetical protein
MVEAGRNALALDFFEKYRSMFPPAEELQRIDALMAQLKVRMQAAAKAPGQDSRIP